MYTDHKPLCSILTAENLNARLKRYSIKLQQWLVQVEYIQGKENTLADALSRMDDEKTAAGSASVSLVPGGCGGGPPQKMNI